MGRSHERYRKHLARTARPGEVRRVVIEEDERELKHAERGGVALSNLRGHFVIDYDLETMTGRCSLCGENTRLMVIKPPPSAHRGERELLICATAELAKRRDRKKRQRAHQQERLRAALRAEGKTGDPEACTCPPGEFHDDCVYDCRLGEGGTGPRHGRTGDEAL